MNRHEERIFLMEKVYRHLLLHDDLQASLNAEENEEGYSDFISSILVDISNNENVYKGKIEQYLNKWSFDRLNLVDQAIMLVALSELQLNLNDKAVVINEALQLSKKYSDPDNYRYINGVLDRL